MIDGQIKRTYIVLRTTTTILIPVNGK